MVKVTMEHSLFHSGSRNLLLTCLQQIADTRANTLPPSFEIVFDSGFSSFMEFYLKVPNEKREEDDYEG